ncbi:MAG: hypothetical protein AAGF74_02375 [Pseudomonadota bacterium]
MKSDQVKQSLPAASVVLVASAGVESIERLLTCLRRQTIAGELEVVLAARPHHVAALNAIPAGNLYAIHAVEADFSTSARARAAAIAKVEGPIIIFCEDHAFPIGDDWAERFIAAHSSGYAAVGPVVRNANPATPASWANLAVEYGPWMHSVRAQEVDTLPGHNSSYKRAVLARYGNALSDVLEAEWVLHKDLRENGETLYLDPGIAVEHLNFSRLGATLKLHFFEGWMFAASRSATWGWAQRLLYTVAFPAIACVRFVRVSRDLMANPEAKGHALRSLPMCFFLLTISALGEGIGYALGDCNRRGTLGEMEFDRWKNLRANERNLTRAA